MFIFHNQLKAVFVKVKHSLASDLVCLNLILGRFKSAAKSQVFDVERHRLQKHVFGCFFK